MNSLCKVVMIALLLGSCTRIESLIDRVPPRVVEVTPHEWKVPVTTSWIFRFSKPFAPISSASDYILLVEAKDVDDKLLKDFNNTSLTAAHKRGRIPCEVEPSSDHLSLVVKPKFLRSQTRYAFLISSDLKDLAGNPLVDGKELKAHYRYDFATIETFPQIVAHDLPVLANEEVSSERRRFSFVFSKEVTGFDLQSVHLEGAIIESMIYYPHHKRLVITLPKGELKPNAPYSFTFSSKIKSTTGQILEPQTIVFKTQAESKIQSDLLETIEMEAHDTSAILHWQTRDKTDGRIWYGEKGGPMNCLGIACPLRVFATLPLLNKKQVGDSGSSVIIDHLILGKEYEYRLVLDDNQGRKIAAKGVFVTSPMPKVVVNEIMINPSTAKKIEGEYVELVNYGDAPLSLENFTVEFEHDKSPPKRCMLPVAKDFKLGAKEYLLLVGKDFTADAYPGLLENRLLRMEKAQICGSLNNGVRQKVVLRDASRRVVSSFSGHLLAKEKGRSIERTAFTATDEKSSFCYSRSDVGPTPAQENGVASKGCDEIK